jgi:putative transport protein
MTSPFLSQMLVLFAILALGSGIGQLSFRGISLGSAGVLFVALVFGHFGLGVPRELMELGLLLFAYAVGLQAGPRFFRSFRRHGMQYVLIALVTVGVGAGVTVALAYGLGLPFNLAAGLYSGALTCTPALAAITDALDRISPGASAAASVGYGIAYPFGMIGLVLLVQLLPHLLRRDLRKEEARWLEERRVESPGLEARQFRISNPNLDGKMVSEINPHRMTRVNISRVKRGERVFAATADLVIHLGDVVMAVGAPEELEKMHLLLGEETHERMDVNADVLSVDVEVSEESLTGKKLAQLRVWEQFTVVITRIRRQGQEIAPTGDATLEMGDNLRVVGDKEAVEAFVKLVHGRTGKAEETNMLPFLVGLALGIALGAVPVNLPDGIQVRLGSAGGAFLVSLLVGHFGGIGPLRLYVPPAAKNLSRELGLMLFLAGAGTSAGARFVEILRQQGVGLLISGILITSLSVLVGILFMSRVYRMNLLSIMGSMAACMTNPPGLAAAQAQTETELPTLSYASVYPVALIFKILLGQVLVEVLRLLLG